MNTPEPIHPGEHLAEFIEELGISQYRLAKTIDVPPIRINAIIKRRRSITADTALRIGRALGTTPEYWLNLQRMYDIDVARSTTDVSRIRPLTQPSAQTQLEFQPSRGSNGLTRRNRPRTSDLGSRRIELEDRNRAHQ